MSSVITVSQLNGYLSFKLKNDVKLKGIMLQGEISNLVNHNKTGHIYFTLKDNSSSIKAVMFASNASHLKYSLNEGMNVIAMGNIEVFERDGLYQLYCTDIHPSGIGQLYIAYEQLKEKLEKQGLFDDEHKKPLPEFPEKIGIITSSTGAALQDILTILNRRYPIGEVTVFSAIVQGEQAPASLEECILKADNSELDVLIIGRGGGSFEDLMAFNSEKVVRAIYNCKTPIISAIGHETDTTIADFVSDLRAPTPSAAAELVSPDIASIMNIILSLKNQLDFNINKRIDNLFNYNNLINEKLNNLSPINKLNIMLLENNSLEKRMITIFKSYINNKEQNLSEKISLLNSLSPLNILARGYSLTYKGNQLITDSNMLNIGDEVKIKLNSSELLATITKI